MSQRILENTKVNTIFLVVALRRLWMRSTMGLGFSRTSSSGRSDICESDWAIASGANVASWASGGSGIFPSRAAEVASGRARSLCSADLALAFRFFFWVFERGVGGGAPGTMRCTTGSGIFGGLEKILFWTRLMCSCLRWLKAKKKSTRPFSRSLTLQNILPASM